MQYSRYKLRIAEPESLTSSASAVMSSRGERLVFLEAAGAGAPEVEEAEAVDGRADPKTTAPATALRDLALYRGQGPLRDVRAECGYS